MSRPRLIDLGCKAGGAAMGYHLAGFEVVGVDIEPQPNYPFEFHQGDMLTYPLAGYDAAHSSPPCEEHSVLNAVNQIDYGTGWLLPAMMRRLADSGLPYVVENVGGADMPGALVLCGSEFGLRTTIPGRGEFWLARHRKFVSNVFLWGAGGCNCYGKRIIGVYGGGAGGRKTPTTGPGVAQASREVMQIDWMTRDELDKAIPPAYTHHIGTQLLEHLAARDAA